ncbi:SpoIIE family protein phosphatase [Planosporangium sp. 12N6]|uniref:SpoIIE family protein phosphatase n=1 Tax=Planosporangium spinosum TaxID=3402278 RepID=UPI003CFB33D7
MAVASDEPAGQAVGGTAGPIEESAEELYENAPCGYLSTRPDGTIVRINHTLLEWLGYDRAELGRRTFQSLLTVGGRIYHETHVRPLLSMQGSVREIAVELLRRDGSRLPALVNSVVRADGSGAPAVVRTTVFDATSRRGYERELLTARRAAERSERRLAVLHRLVSEFAVALTPADVGEVLVSTARQETRAVGGMLWMLTADGAALVRVSAASPVDEPLLLRTPLAEAMPHVEAVRCNEIVLLDSVEAARRAYPLFAVVMADVGRAAALFVPLAVGERVLGAVGFSFDRSREISDDDLELLRTLGRQAGQALERARLHAETVERRRQAEFLAALSRDLDRAPGLRQRADRLVAALVPEIARWARVELLDNRVLAPLAAAGGDRSRVAQPPVIPGASAAHVAAALAQGTPQVAGVDGVDEAALPLRAAGRVVGVLVLGLSGAAHAHGLTDFLTELAESAGLALENGRLYDQERENAHTLQRALLAGEPPRDPRVAVTTLYRPAGEDLEVGGDWYDAFPVGPDRMALVVGDVVGRGIRAASVMGQVRSAIRALAATGPTPAVLLERLDRFVDRFEAGRVSTVAYGELDLSTGRLRYACAGHLPPLLVEADGSHRFLWGGRSGPLAASAGIKARGEDEVELRPGSRLLLYTDGLIERRDRGLEVGLELLAEEAGCRHRAPLGGILPDLAAALADPRHRDDVCLLCVAFGTEPRFDREVEADVARLKGLRDDFRAWLDTVPVGDDEREALLLVCSEAVANAIEHGYRGDRHGVVSVRAELTGGVLELTVRDRGSWRVPDPRTDRGRGLSLMRSLMDRVLVEHGAGTVVTMRRRIVSEAAA